MSARRGLVVAGGGAKGAFSFGCLKALHESGIQFEAVSGTSAGALNAAIWSSRSIVAGEAVWAQATPATTYDREARFKVLPRPLARLLGVFSIVSTVLIARYDDYPLPDRYVRWADRMLMVVKAAAITTALLAVSNFGILCNTAVVVVWVLVLPGKKSEAIRSLDLPAASGFAMLPSAALFAWLYERPSFFFPQVESSLLLGVTIGIFLLLQFDTARASVKRLIYSPMRWSALDSRPLAKTIHTFLNDNPLIIPTYVTVATRKEYVDPSDQYWSGVWRRRPLGFHKEEGPWRMRTKFAWVPTYVRVDSLGIHDAAEWLLASAALPFGVVPPVLSADTSYVDGGVVDNVPILPLLAHDLDEVWILYLTPEDGTCGSNEDERRRCVSVAKLVHESSAKIPVEIASDERPAPLAFEDYVCALPSADKWPKVIPICPNSGLGGDLRRTSQLLSGVYDEAHSTRL